jgi:hypothetical protein
MSDLAALSKESVKSLGVGAYLVNVLPSAVLVLSVVALFDSHLLPWSSPISDGGHTIAPGPASVVHEFKVRGVVGGIVLGLAVLVVAVLLRPLQIRAVQLLEGYWTRGGLAKALAVERHLRRLSAIDVRARTRPPPAEGTDFPSVVRHARQRHRGNIIKERAKDARESYPAQPEWILPTMLGNVLRRAETTAGQRYGLETVHAYPRLYPYLSPRLDAELKEQLNGIDVMAIFVLVFSTQALLSAPLVWLLDWWSLIPVALAVLVAVAYRGATAAAQNYGQLLAAAFDLHRFDMLAAMHLPLEDNGDSEYRTNSKLSELMAADKAWPAEKRKTLTYAHPPAPAVILTTTATPAATGTTDGESPAKDSGAGSGSEQGGPQPDHPDGNLPGTAPE